jgi:hypothetical protein
MRIIGNISVAHSKRMADNMYQSIISIAYSVDEESPWTVCLSTTASKVVQQREAKRDAWSTQAPRHLPDTVNLS